MRSIVKFWWGQLIFNSALLMRKKGHFQSQIMREQMRNMRNKSRGNGRNNCTAFRILKRNGIAIENPTFQGCEVNKEDPVEYRRHVGKEEIG